MLELIEFLQDALQGFKIIFNFIIKILLVIPYTIKFIFSKIFNIPKILSKKILNKKKNLVGFDEFEEIEDLVEQEEKERQELEHRYAVLGKTYMDSLIDKNNDGTVIDDFSTLNKKITEVNKDLNDFKVLDSVKVNKQRIAEGAKLGDIRENQKNFDMDLFKKWSMQIFKLIKIGNDAELEVIKKVMTEQMYNNFIDQMQKFENDGLQFITEDLFIKDVSLYDYAKGMSKEEIKILIIAKMKEYIIDKNTNVVIRGSREKAYEKKIVMTFLKENKEDEEGFLKNCPNCGAETTQVEFGKCDYCGTLVFPIRYNWTLIKFETM